ncbi:MAG: adenylate kinase [Limnochordia bacterium]
MRLVIMGLPGAGKGTQALLISERFNVPHISTGAMFRATKGQDSPLAQAVARYANKGELVPDDLVYAMVKQRLAQPDCQRGFLLDGFPRTISQGEMLEKLLDELGMGLDGALDIVITPEEAIRRIVLRKTCPACRATYPHRPAVCQACESQLMRREDDNEPTARRRIEVYNEQTAPVVDYYRQRGLLLQVDGMGTVESTFQRVLSVLGNIGTDEVVG